MSFTKSAWIRGVCLILGYSKSEAREVYLLWSKKKSSDGIPLAVVLDAVTNKPFRSFQCITDNGQSTPWVHSKPAEIDAIRAHLAARNGPVSFYTLYHQRKGVEYPDRADRAADVSVKRGGKSAPVPKDNQMALDLHDLDPAQVQSWFNGDFLLQDQLTFDFGHFDLGEHQACDALHQVAGVQWLGAYAHRRAAKGPCLTPSEHNALALVDHEGVLDVDLAKRALSPSLYVHPLPALELGGHKSPKRRKFVEADPTPISAPLASQSIN